MIINAMYRVPIPIPIIADEATRRGRKFAYCCQSGLASVTAVQVIEMFTSLFEAT